MPNSLKDIDCFSIDIYIFKTYLLDTVLLPDTESSLLDSRLISSNLTAFISKFTILGALAWRVGFYNKNT